MENKYGVCVCTYESSMELEVWNTVTGKDVKNKEEWFTAMRSEEVLEYLWNNYVEDYNKDGE